MSRRACAPSCASAGGFARGREPDVRELLDLVALGTIADLVPLDRREPDPDRRSGCGGCIAARGRASRRCSQAAGVDADREIDARTVAWKLAPRINAPGRLGAAEPSLSLLLADAETAAERAQVLEAANAERRAVQDRVMEEALAKLGDRSGAGDRARGRGLAGGVVGIVAAKLVDKFQRPAFVVGIDPATGIGRGSARTTGGVNLYEALALRRRRASTGSAAMRPRRASRSSARASRSSPRRSARRSRGSPRARARCRRDRDVDAEVRLAEVDERLAAGARGLGPFGQENPAPLLVDPARAGHAVRGGSAMARTSS